MQQLQPQKPSKATWQAGRKLTTDRGKTISDFTMKTFFYTSSVNTETGEITQDQWLYRGWHYKRQYALIGQIYKTELDVLLVILKHIQMNCQRVLIYDNSLSGFDETTGRPMAEIFHASEGKIKITKLKNYEISVPKFHITPHQK